MKTSLLVAALGFGVSAAWGQSVLSARSGTIHNVTGEAYISGKDLKPTKTGEFPALENGQRIQTKEARAEILLTPGVFLRLGENSEAELVNNALTDTVVRVISGSALIEAGEPVKDTLVTIQTGAYSGRIAETGIYRFDAEPSRVRVFTGKMPVQITGGKLLTLHQGHELANDGDVATRFDRKVQDELYAWSNSRSAMVARANFVAAQSAGKGTGGLNSWVYVPYMGIFTYLPGNGMYMNPFGYNYYSPSYMRVYYVSRPSTYSASNGNGGANSGLGSSAVRNTGSADSSFGSAPMRSSAPAASAGGGGFAGSHGGGARR